MATARAPYEPVIIGADIGNATTSIARPDGAAAFFPSVIADSTRAYDGMSKIATDRHHVTYKGQHAVVGLDAFEMHGDTILNETAAPHARYVDETSLLCFLAGIGAAFPTTDTVGVRLATGAPLSIYEAHGAEIAALYQGTHEFAYNGHARRVVVERVTVKDFSHGHPLGAGLRVHIFEQRRQFRLRARLAEGDCFIDVRTCPQALRL